MKKPLLLLLCCALFAAATYAQSLSLSWTGGAISNGQLITVSGDTTGTVYSYVSCTNQNASTLGVKVKKKYISIVPGSQNTFCWGNCYLPNTFVSSDIIYIAKDSTSEEFSGEYKAQGNIGTSVVMYTFFDESNPDDSIAVQVAYDCALGIENPDAMEGQISFSGAYPNPASHQTSFTYSLPASEHNAQLVIRDMVGNVVSRILISDLSGTLKVETGDLSDGVYFYSLMLNEQPYITRKLVIKH